MIPIIVLAALLVALVALAGVMLVRRGRGAAPAPAAPAPALGKPADLEARPAPAIEIAPSERAEPEPGPEPDPVVADAATVEPAPSRPRLRDRLGKVRSLFAGHLGDLRSRGAIDQAAWDDLEESLIRADVGVATTQALLTEVRERVGESVDPEDLLGALRDAVESRLSRGERELVLVPGEPNVWLFVGVNGVGKTTSIGKVALSQRAEGRSVLMAAADTFRAAAAEQLELWAQRAGADLVRGQEGADPGSVIFDAMAAAHGRGVDLVLADTAGRLHTKTNLMEELAKLRRIVDRTPGALKEVLLVIDASTGQNGLVQARQFAEAVGVTGVVLTKLDGTPKGGIVLAIAEELGIPVKLVGVGESPEDLMPFDPREFAEAIFA